MAQDFDQTMDVLLRQHGRQAASRPAVKATPHLDPDEMNAFAENALPPPVRLLYLEHLADCAACRRTVTELTLASGLAFQEEPATVAIKPPTVAESQPGGWRAWLSALLNPAVLRYAAPAVLLFAVTAGAFVLLRTSSRDTAAPQTEVARNTEASAPASKPAPPVSAEPQAGPAMPPDSATPALPGVTNSQPTPGELVARNDGPAKTATAKKDAPANTGLASENESLAAAPPPPPLPQPTVAREPLTEAKAKTGAETQRQPDLAAGSAVAGDAAPAPKPAATSPADVQDDGRARDEDRVRTAGGPGRAGGKSLPIPMSRARKQPRQDSADNKEERESDEQPETRTVSGRVFTQRGGVWIDNACSKGCGTIRLRRGSDEYKNADAGLRAIADQLSGEVVAVWKGKAYRIQ